jgi:hypothetical protein
MSPSTIGIIICLVIVLIIIVITRTYRNGRKERARPSRALAREIDKPEVRARVALTVSGSDGRDEFAGMSSDDLFAIAVANMRIMDDAGDIMSARNRAGTATVDVAREYNAAAHRARKAMSRAIKMRKQESATDHQARAITLGVLRDRAHNLDARPIGDPYHAGAHRGGVVGTLILRQDEIIDDATIDAPQTIAPTVGLPLAPVWSSDPENVHDSAVGSAVIRKIGFMRANDLHATTDRNIYGKILHEINQYQNPFVGADELAERRNRAKHIMHRASADEYCSRYSIKESEALRLVYERMLRADSDEARANMRDALVSAMSECSPDGSDVCLVGRITRYVGALDHVDPEIGEPTKSVDAFRATLFAKLGQMTAQHAPAREMRAMIMHECDSAATDLPVAVSQKMRQDALAGVEDDDEGQVAATSSSSATSVAPSDGAASVTPAPS